MLSFSKQGSIPQMYQQKFSLPASVARSQDKFLLDATKSEGFRSAYKFFLMNFFALKLFGARDFN